MRAIILAAGQGSRLGELTSDRPKCLIPIEDNSLLEIQINTLHSCGIEDIAVVRGFQGRLINIPGLSFFENPRFAETNTLHSLLCAEPALSGDLLILYSDILYEPQVVRRLMDATNDIALGVMVNWKEAFRQRNAIALQDMEMVYFDSGNRVGRIGKSFSGEFEAQGQFVGMVKCSAWGTEILKRNYQHLRALHAGKPFGRGRIFDQAWLTDLFQEMTLIGVPLHCVIIEKGWLEIDTPEDYERALQDTQFVRRLVKKKTDWSMRAGLYNDLDWVNRDELLRVIVECAEDVNGKDVLDVGTGTGKVLMALRQASPLGRFHGVDLSASMMEKIGPDSGFSLHCCSAEKLDIFDDGSFDVVTARMVFHHLENIDKATAEIHRVLRPGGRFVLCEGNPPDMATLEFYKEMFRFKEDRRSFLLDDLVNILVRGQFKAITSRTVITRGMSLNNWLDNSGLPFRNIDIIKRMHSLCDMKVREAYNMRQTADDIFMDWKFSVVYGLK